MNNMTSSRLLQRAADDIEKNGLYKGGFFKDENTCEGPACLTGALIRAKYQYVAKKQGTKMEPVSNSYDKRFSNAIVKGALNKLAKTVLKDSDGTTADKMWDLISWNDTEHRRKGEVVAALRKASKV